MGSTLVVAMVDRLQVGLELSRRQADQASKLVREVSLVRITVCCPASRAVSAASNARAAFAGLVQPRRRAERRAVHTRSNS